jgi:hypothetical protein
MKTRYLLVAASAAAILAGSTYGLMADSQSSSQSGTAVVSHGSANSGSTSIVATGSSQNASGTDASAGSEAVGFGLAGQNTTSSRRDTNSSSSIALGAGASWGWAKVGSDKGKDTPNGGGGENGGGASSLQCTVDITDWSEWRLLKPEVRQVVLNCECVIRQLPQPHLAPNANQLCPVNSPEIFMAARQ